MVKEKISSDPLIEKKLSLKYNFVNNNKIKLLVTMHRRESHGKYIYEICLGLLELLKDQKDIEIIISVHPNPNVKEIINKTLSNKKNIYLIEPPNYIEFVYLMSKTNSKHRYFTIFNK